MFTTWDAVSTLDRMFDDVMGSMVGTAIVADGHVFLATFSNVLRVYGMLK